jgi:hypothetical protein
VGYRNHLDHKKTRRLIREAAQRMEQIMAEGIDRVDAALTGIAGDIQRLKAAADALQAALDLALAAQDEVVAAAVAEAIAGKQAEFEDALAPLVAKAEALDAATPEA